MVNSASTLENTLVISERFKYGFTISTHPNALFNGSEHF